MTPPNADNKQVVEFRYKHYRTGEIELRSAIPDKLYFGKTEWHPDEQWIMRAYDLGKDAVRHFALKDCNFLITS